MPIQATTTQQIPASGEVIVSTGSQDASARPVRFVDTQASVLLDLVRGLSALAVLLEHWRMLLFVSYPAIPSHRWAFALPYLVCSAGHQAVVIFFVLSGYLVSGSVFRMFAQERWSWRSYGLHRLTRLWTVLIPGLAITALWDQIGMRLHRASAVALYAGLSGDRIVHNVRQASTIDTCIGNLFFLQTIRVLPFGSDQSLWSLANEFWYYVLFPLGFIVLRTKSGIGNRVGSAVLFLLIAAFLGPNIIVMFPIWLLGTVLAICPPPKLGHKARWTAAVIYIPTFFFCSRFDSVPLLYRDYLVGAATLGLLWILLSAQSATYAGAPYTRAGRTLARFSYTLYVVHLPLLVLIAALAVGPERWTPTTLHVAAGVGVLMLVACFSFLLARVTEFKTDAIRAKAERLLGL